MVKTDVHPDDVLETLLAKSPRSDKATKLRHLHVICANHHAQNHSVRDFSLASVGRLCKSQSLFKTERTLYNAGSEDYCILINSWATFSGSTSIKVTQREPKFPPEHRYLTRIEDHAIRSIMQGVIAQRDRFKQQLHVLKQQVRIEIDQRPLGAVVGNDSATTVVIALKNQFTDSERQSLARAISVDFLEDQGWELGSDGEIYTANGTLLFDPGFASAIAKILGG
jgi:hypothetical protein